MKTTISSLYALSSLLVPVVIIYISPPGTDLFSWHPVLMSMAITLFMGNAVVVFNQAFDLFALGNRKVELLWHWTFQALAILMLWVGFATVYVNKNLLSKPHFVSWHGCVGLVAVVGAVGASMGGVATKYGLRIPPLIRPAHIKWVHSVAGTVIFTVGCVALLLGLASNWALREMNRLERCGLGTMVVFMLLVVWYLAKNNYLLRIFVSK